MPSQWLKGLSKQMRAFSNSLSGRSTPLRMSSSLTGEGSRAKVPDVNIRYFTKVGEFSMAVAVPGPSLGFCYYF
jgi:hypothetical protein